MGACDRSSRPRDSWIVSSKMPVPISSIKYLPSLLLSNPNMVCLVLSCFDLLLGLYSFIFCNNETLCSEKKEQIELLLSILTTWNCCHGWNCCHDFLFVICLVLGSFALRVSVSKLWRTQCTKKNRTCQTENRLTFCLTWMFDNFSCRTFNGHENGRPPPPSCRHRAVHIFILFISHMDM